MIVGYNGIDEDTCNASFPQKEAMSAVVIRLYGEEIQSGFGQFDISSK